MNRPPVTVRRLSGFDDPSLPPAAWNALLASGPTDAVFLRWEYQRSWWEAFERTGLLLLVAERDGRPVALAPLFAEDGMAYLVGSGGSDYLDLVGDTGDPAVLDALLAAVRAHVPGFVGLRLYHVPEASPTGTRLGGAARRLGWACAAEGELVAPVLDLERPAGAPEPWSRRSMLRHERALRRDGRLEVSHLSDGREVGPHLDAFFAQHVARWAATPHPSLFHDRRQRTFYRLLADRADGWLRFTRVAWDGAPVAFHFGFSHGGRYLWYKPSFDPIVARRSPGEVMLRHLLLAAAAEGARIFDFGLGDEPFKARYATRVTRVRTWGAYAPGAARGAETVA